MDRVTRLYLSSYHGAGHIPQRRIGVLYLLGLPIPWLVLTCRTCSHPHPCPTLVRARVAAGEVLTWMTPAVLAHLEGRSPAFIAAVPRQRDGAS